MPVTNYYTVDGEIVGESTGSTVINYATDALGSVTGTLVGGQLQNTYVYKPYGSLLAQTYTGSAPTLKWVGNLGYRPTSRALTDYDAEQRYVATSTGRWASAAPTLWPSDSAYTFASCRPISNRGRRAGWGQSPADDDVEPRISIVTRACRASCVPNKEKGKPCVCDIHVRFHMEATLETYAFMNCYFYQFTTSSKSVNHDLKRVNNPPEPGPWYYDDTNPDGSKEWPWKPAPNEPLGTWKWVDDPGFAPPKSPQICDDMKADTSKTLEFVSCFSCGSVRHYYQCYRWSVKYTIKKQCQGAICVPPLNEFAQTNTEDGDLSSKWCVIGKQHSV